jgi:hypothetical protein
MKHTYIKKTKCKTLGNKFKSLSNQAIFYSRYIITSSWLIIPFLTISSTRCTCRFLYMGRMELYTIFITNKIIPLRCIIIKPFDCIIPCMQNCNKNNVIPKTWLQDSNWKYCEVRSFMTPRSAPLDLQWTINSVLLMSLMIVISLRPPEKHDLVGAVSSSFDLRWTVELRTVHVVEDTNFITISRNTKSITQDCEQ